MFSQQFCKFIKVKMSFCAKHPFVFLLLLNYYNLAWTEQTCTDEFKYIRNEEEKIVGLIRISFPERRNVIKLKVNLSLKRSPPSVSIILNK